MDATVCVSECPDTSTDLTDPDICKPNSVVKDCTGISQGYYQTAYNTTRYFGKICLPESGTDIADDFRDEIMGKFGGGSIITRYLYDVVICWWVFLICGISAFILGFVYLIILRLLAKVVVWLTIVSLFFVIIAAGVGFWFYKNKFETSEKSYSFCKWTAIILWIAAALYLILVFCCCRSIRIGVAVIEATARFVATTPKIFFVPIIFFFLIVAWFIYFMGATLFIWTSGHPKKRGSTPFGEMKWDGYTYTAYWYNIFGYFWFNAFLIGSCQFVLAVSCATWYFTHTDDTRGKAKVRRGFWWLFRYHLGTIAYGSFIIAIC